MRWENGMFFMAQFSIRPVNGRGSTHLCHAPTSGMRVLNTARCHEISRYDRSRAVFFFPRTPFFFNGCNVYLIVFFKSNMHWILANIFIQTILHPSSAALFPFISFESSPEQHVGVSIVMGISKNGWFLMGNPTKIDDLGVPPWLWKPPCEFIRLFLFCVTFQALIRGCDKTSTANDRRG